MFYVPYKEWNECNYMRCESYILTHNRDAIHFACAAGRLQLVKVLVIDFGQAENEDNGQRVPLHYATDYERTEIVAYLVEKGVHIDKKDANVDLFFT